MITKADWDKLTPQQQWDQYCLLESMVNPDGENDIDQRRAEISAQFWQDVREGKNPDYRMLDMSLHLAAFGGLPSYNVDPNPDEDEPQTIFGIPIVYKKLTDIPEGSVILRVRTPDGWLGIQSPKRRVPDQRPKPYESDQAT